MGCSASSQQTQPASASTEEDFSRQVSGDSVTSESLRSAHSGASSRTGEIVVRGRYNRLPKRLDDDYDLQTDVLGSGYNGNVLLAFGKGKQKKGRFAVKAFKLSGVSEEMQKILLAELEVFLGVDHPNIVRLVDVYEAEDMLYMVMECMEGGTLFKRLRKCKSFSEEDAADLTKQMLLAVNYLHNRNIVHRDLKLENFLFASKDTNQVKLIDFGFSRIWRPANQKVMTWNCGTLSHAAPEVLKRNYTSQCDLWSLGTIVFILLSGKEPFLGTVDEILRAIVEGRFCMSGEEWGRVSEQGKGFVGSLLTVDPQKRLTAERALQHPWILQQKVKKKRGSKILEKALVDGLVKFGQVSTLRRACMMMMALSLSADQNAELHDAFLAVDTDQTGLIKISEFKVVVQQHFDLHDEDLNQAFNAVDQYNDGVIHYSEFLAACITTRIAVCDDLLEAAFNRFDIKRNGVIEAEELAQVLGSSFSKDQIQELVREASASRNDHISYDDFIGYLRSGSSEQSRRVSETLIDKEQRLERETTGSKELARSGGPPHTGVRSGENLMKAFSGRISGTFKSRSNVFDERDMIVRSPNCSHQESQSQVSI